MFSCEVCEIFKSTYFYRTPLVATSDYIPLGHTVSRKQERIRCETSEKCCSRLTLVLFVRCNPLTPLNKMHCTKNEVYFH